MAESRRAAARRDLPALASLAARWAGLLLLLGFLLGWFTHPERQALVRRLDLGEAIAVEDPLAQELVEALGAGSPDGGAAADARLRKVDPDDESPKARVAVMEAGGEVHPVGTMEEIYWWALETNEGYAWAGFLLLLGATAFDTMGRRRAAPPPASGS